MADILRGQGIACEIYPDTTNKLDKQFKYANKRNIPFIVIIGDKELREKTCNIKNLATGEQKIIKQDELVEFDWEKNWIVKEIE
ncbi:MAG: hypothetical protein JST96_18630 [Bacteroidetes bacterium]|nr:hypothetical protein [Bacteroidota bacterium]